MLVGFLFSVFNIPSDFLQFNELSTSSGICQQSLQAHEVTRL